MTEPVSITTSVNILNVTLNNKSTLNECKPTPPLFGYSKQFAHFYFPEYNNEIVIVYTQKNINMNQIESILCELMKKHFNIDIDFNQDNYIFSFDFDCRTNIYNFGKFNSLGNTTDELKLSNELVDKISNRRIIIKKHSKINLDWLENFNTEAISINSNNINQNSQYNLRIKPNDSILQLKKRLEEFDGITADSRIVLYKGKSLQDEKIISETGITDNSSIKWYLRLKTGPYDFNYERPQGNPSMLLYNEELQNSIRIK